ncbi:hypothetical protein [Bacillus marasmi]|uniref:hypothetical protein n=1 Tax=Bacillus marasmi TaxID=1926279 RepID=UPI0011CB4EB3|nr:hypothetical protein [Bacillus marasmi]
MLKKRIILLSILSFITTSFSPYLFAVYFEKKPTEIHRNAKFGGPFPFAEQEIYLPKKEQQYPIEVNFASPLKKETKLHFFPFILSFLSFFLIIFSLVTIVLRLFWGQKNGQDDRI